MLKSAFVNISLSNNAQMLALAAQTFWIGINHLNWYQSIECWRYQRSDCIWINWVLKKKHMCGHMCLCVALLENTSGHIFWKCILEIHSDIQICSYLYLHDKIVFIFSVDTSQTNEVQRFISRLLRVYNFNDVNDGWGGNSISPAAVWMSWWRSPGPRL